DGLVARVFDVLAADENRVDVDLPDDIPPVEVDPGQIERALVNVIENALKFSDSDSRVALNATSEGGDESARDGEAEPRPPVSVGSGAPDEWLEHSLADSSR